MNIVVYIQYYWAKSADRQKELDECLRRNLNHSGINRVMLFLESDSPPLPTASVPVEAINSNERMTYAEWVHCGSRQGPGIRLVANAYVCIDEELEHLGPSFDRLDPFLALMHYILVKVGLRLNGFSHCMQNVEDVSVNPEHPESLIYANSFPLGFTDCNYVFTYALLSQGFRSCKPCYRLLDLQLQTSTVCVYDKTCSGYYGGASYVHPFLAQDEAEEMKSALWISTLHNTADTIKSPEGRIRSSATTPWHRCSCWSPIMSKKLNPNSASNQHTL